MTAEQVIAALALPPQAFVNQRVPKKHLLDNGAPTPADKRAITDGVEELTWVAALKPATVGVPAYQDAEREYLEIAVLSLTLRQKARVARLRELVHRAIPYPVVLLADGFMSLAELRKAQNEAGKMVLDGELLAADPSSIADRLKLADQPATDLGAVYRGWCNRLRPLVRRAAMLSEIEGLRREAGCEPQVARRVELNLKIQQLVSELPPP